MSDIETALPITTGMTGNTNVATLDSAAFELLENLYPYRGTLKVEPFFLPYLYKEGTGRSDNYIFINNYSTKTSLFAVKIDKALYVPNHTGEATVPLVKLGDLYDDVDSTTLYTDFDDTAILQYSPWAWTTSSSAFFTKPGLPLSRIVEDNTKPYGYKIEVVPATFVGNVSQKPVYISAKYIIATKDRLFLANCWEDGQYLPTRIHWSDLNKPLNFATSNTSEADVFDLGVNSDDITGLAYTNSVVIILTKNSIWRSDYQGFETKFKTSLLTSNTGCLFHYSTITINEVVYFIGKDNFYALNRLTLVPIGTDIWDWWKANVNFTGLQNVIAQYELEQNSITWVFPRKVADDSKLWGLKYNIDEAKWSTRDLQI